MSQIPTEQPAADRATILVADDDAAVRGTIREILAHAGHSVFTAADGNEVLRQIREHQFDLVLTDLVFPPTDGIRILEQVKRARAATVVVVFSGSPTVETVIAAFRKGALDFLPKPVDGRQLLQLARRVVSLRRMGEQRRRMAEQLESEREKVLELRGQLGLVDPFRRLVGSSSSLLALVEALREVARTESTILLTGESGTGKGLVARTIHEASARRDGPFVEANCVVYSEGVLHSELFGHERGAFTGAARTKRGRFELAHGGTLFLDEIGEIAPGTQLMLLRVLQERTFERVGGEDTLTADVRLIAATNRDLEEAIRRGTFRADLFYRLNVIPIRIPPLRERAEDIPLLAQHFLRRSAEAARREVHGFSAEAIDVLMGYPWPGNVRELENLVERLVVLSRGERIESHELPATLTHTVARGAAAAPRTLQQIERQRIIEVMREAGGNKKLAARRLGIHRSTLYAKLRRYGLLGGGGTAASGECRATGQDVSDPPTPPAKASVG